MIGLYELLGEVVTPSDKTGWAVKPFPTPEKSSWNDLEVEFADARRVRLTIGRVSETRDYTEMGFRNARNGKETLAWNFLRLLAKNGGSVKWQGKKARRPPSGSHRERSETVNQSQSGPPVRDQGKSRVREIRARFKRIFGIDEDPFERYTLETGYRVRFRLRCDPSGD